jgi:FkbM family methyltransferase
MNRLGNAGLSERIHLRKEAVAGVTRLTEWVFDESNPGGSGLFATVGSKFTVQIRAFEDVMNSLSGTVELAKIDIEGAEFELLSATPQETWKRVNAISLELHDDPQGKTTQTEFLKRMREYGFKIEEETVCSFFLHR